MNINYFDQVGQKKLVHTINGTAIAIPRILLNIIETYWDQKANCINIPEAVKPFLPFDRIEIPRSSLLNKF